MIEVQNRSTNEQPTVAPRDSAPDGVRVVDLRKGFDGVDGNRLEVLRGVMMDVKPGESVAIMGASGSGKSTLLHLLGGLEEPDHGFVNIASTDLTRMKQAKLAEFRRKQIGFVFQFHYLLNELTAVENVAMPLLIDRRKSVEALEIARSLLGWVGLEERIDHPVSKLSGGEQQRVAVARALINAPLLVLADEPTGNLDEVIGDGIAKLLVNYAREQSKIAIIATHNHRVAHFCDRILELRTGCLHTPGA